MRYYSYNDYKTEPGVDDYVGTVSEEDIRKTYYPYWHRKMVERFGIEYVEQNCSFEDCLDDWIVVNWAWEVKE